MPPGWIGPSSVGTHVREAPFAGRSRAAESLQDRRYLPSSNERKPAPGDRGALQPLSEASLTLQQLRTPLGLSDYFCYSLYYQLVTVITRPRSTSQNTRYVHVKY